MTNEYISFLWHIFICLWIQFHCIVEVTLRLTISQPICLGIEHPCGTCDYILLPVGMLLSEICGIYILQQQGGPVIPPGTGFPSRRLLRLAGLRWRYSKPPPKWGARSPYIYPSGTGWSSPNSKSRYDRRSVSLDLTEFT
jgi:hypothetical protein